MQNKHGKCKLLLTRENFIVLPAVQEIENKTIIIPLIFYCYETRSLALREEHRLRVFENKVLRKIFGAKENEITREWRKLHDAELHALYSSPNN